MYYHLMINLILESGILEPFKLFKLLIAKKISLILPDYKLSLNYLNV